MGNKKMWEEDDSGGGCVCVGRLSRERRVTWETDGGEVRVK